MSPSIVCKVVETSSFGHLCGINATPNRLRWTRALRSSPRSQTWEMWLRGSACKMLCWRLCGMLLAIFNYFEKWCSFPGMRGTMQLQQLVCNLLETARRPPALCARSSSARWRAFGGLPDCVWVCQPQKKGQRAHPWQHQVQKEAAAPQRGQQVQEEREAQGHQQSQQEQPARWRSQGSLKCHLSSIKVTTRKSAPGQLLGCALSWRH